MAIQNDLEVLAGLAERVTFHNEEMASASCDTSSGFSLICFAGTTLAQPFDASLCNDGATVAVSDKDVRPFIF